MNALHSTTDTTKKQTYDSYFKPSTFQQFMKDFNEACNLGDQDAIETLTPGMANTLKAQGVG